MKNYIEMQLWLLRKGNYMSRAKLGYYGAMVDCFMGVEDPLDLVALATRPWVNPYQDAIKSTEKLSGVNDRRTDNNGNDFWVEETSVLGD